VSHETHDLPDTNLPRFAGGASLVTSGLVLGALGLVATLLLGFRAPRETLFAYLIAFWYWLGLALGGITLVMANHSAGAKWNVTVRRIGENFGAVIPLFIVLFIPLLLGAKHIWYWVSPAEPVSEELAHLLAHKRPYLNMKFFAVRQVIYFAVWSWFALRLRSLSIRQDETGDASFTQRMRAMSPVGMLIFVLTVTFASFDWLMALQPTWYSTIFGLYAYTGGFVASLALVCLIVTGLRAAHTPWGNLLTVDQQHNLGKLLLAFTAFWAYMAFSQYMLIWAGNLPEELVWIVSRSKGVWRPMGQLLIVGQFVLPFFLLLSRDLKRSTRGLAAVSVWILALHYIDVYWIVMPAEDYQHIGFSLAHITSFLGIGGLSVALCAYLVRGAAPVPVKDPFLEDSLRYVQP
jgi:hypothetical protein